MPRSDRIECPFCGQEIRYSRRSTVVREVTGWVAPREGGGTNHIRKPVPTGRIAHRHCLDEAETQTLGDQLTL